MGGLRREVTAPGDVLPVLSRLTSLAMSGPAEAAESPTPAEAPHDGPPPDADAGNSSTQEGGARDDDDATDGEALCAAESDDEVAGRPAKLSKAKLH